MKFTFWQNVVSIHQSAFIKSLAKEHEVTLVAAEKLDAQRLKEKWDIPDMGRATVVIAPTNEEISRLLDTTGTQHVFSGIDAYPMVYQAFKMAVKRNVDISVMAEPYEWAGIKGWLRRIKYTMLFMRYGRYINHLFTTGNMGVRCYLKAGVPAWKLHQWGYFTEKKNVDIMQSVTVSKPKLLYVGRLDHNKNILNTLKEIDCTDIECFSIVGDGELYNDVRQLAHANPKIKLLGRLSNSESLRVMAEHDYLVLPSLYDGWGAVVNEALSVGTRVLCSEACGASILLDGTSRGEFFTQEDKLAIIKKWASKGPVTAEQRTEVKQWASLHISGDAASRYFVDIINDKDVIAPWIS